MADNVETSTEVEVDLSGLDDAALVEFEALLVADYESKRSAESFSAEETSKLDEIVTTIEAARAEMQFRIDDAARGEKVADVKGASFLERIAAAKASKEVAPVAEVVVAPVAETIVVEAPVAPVVAAVAEAVADVVITPKGLKSDAPVAPVVEEAKPTYSIIASADVPGFKAGQALSDVKQIAEAFIAKKQTVRGTDPGANGSRFLVASARGDYAEDRILGQDSLVNMEKINAVVRSQEALTASGGLCAPLTPLYEIVTYGDAARPVRDSLPGFQATRGGIRFLPPPRLSDLAGSVRRTTAAQDAAGYTNQTPPGSTPPKPCLHVTCEDEQTCIIEAVSKCLTFGNFGSRTFPEQVEAWIRLGMVEFARYAETELLDGIAAGSTALTAGQIYGATGSLLDTVAVLVASFRARNRVSDNIRLRAMFPFWTKEIFKTDLASQAPGDGLGRYTVSDAELNSWLASRGVNITWYQDNTTAAGAPWSPPVTGGVQSWPNTVEWFLFPEGSWLYLDGGTLDLGLVRDSTLNSQNDYQMFYEEFFGVCFVGLESYKITSQLCPNGTYAGPAATLRACVSPGS